jgi:hypothetical protein
VAKTLTLKDWNDDALDVRESTSKDGEFALEFRVNESRPDGATFLDLERKHIRELHAYLAAYL